MSDDNVLHFRPLTEPDGDPVQLAYGAGRALWEGGDPARLLDALLDALDGESMWVQAEFVRGVLDARRAT